MERVAVSVEVRVPPVGRERVLEQVVRAEAREGDVAEIGVRNEDR